MRINFKVAPWHRNISRSLLKAPKYYFFDTGQVIGDNGIKLENLTACTLIKECHYLEDCSGVQSGLYYLRTRDGKEIDFFITKDDAPFLMLELKWGASGKSPNFAYFDRYHPGVKKVQITGEPVREKTYSKVRASPS